MIFFHPILSFFKKFANILDRYKKIVIHKKRILPQIKNSAEDEIDHRAEFERKGMVKAMQKRGKLFLCFLFVIVMALSFSSVSAAWKTHAEEPLLIAAGIPFGVRFHTDGIVVVGIPGGAGPLAEAGLKKGDVITAVDGKKITSVSEFASLVRESEGRAMKLEYQSGELRRLAEVTPRSDENGEYKLGVWIKDSAAGIGTVTYIHTKNLTFAGLGHGICDADSGALVPLSYGTAEEVTLLGVVKGGAGTPGELRGSFTGVKMGKLIKNCESGIYGVLTAIPAELADACYPIGHMDEVQEGKAQIFTTVDGEGRGCYEIEIFRIDKNASGKNFSVRVTDPALLEKTGGIVQGMSGSPIIQNGKLIGAVTHVLVSDATEGYGIFIENMLEAAG